MKKKKQIIGVVGLGYVGLPLAVRAVERGYKVYGFDLDRKKINLINRGLSPIKEKFLEDNLPKFRPLATPDKKMLKKCDIVLICVPTPVDEKFYPVLTPVIDATKLVAKNLKKGALIVLESTVNPGVSEEIMRPLIEKEGFEIGKTVFIAHCPERINPGDKKWNVTNIPRVVGSFEKNGLKKALDFYKSIVDGEIRPMKSIREAEAVKIVENSFRDINIAFVNELAKSFDKLNIDVMDVILGASTKPFAFMPHFPSCGVGGHCIPVDPYYLIERAKQSGFDHEFLKIARKINNSMPLYTIELLQDALNELKLPMKGTTVGVLGVAYKANVDDVRESPSLKIIKQIEKHGALTVVFDPYLPGRSTTKSLEELLKKSKAIVLVTDHNEFKAIEPKLFKKYGVKVVIDGKNCLDKNAIKKLGIVYKGIGR